MATMIVVALVLVFGALFAAMAVAPMAIEAVSARPIAAKRVISPVHFEQQAPRIAPAHEARAA
jgi:hypothetical protein